jgi:myo-inositol 2-dehydrogenase / D-chiro-inositol 1-dehydrogenase
MNGEGLNRRDFLALSGAAVAGLADRATAEPARQERKTVRVGFVGVGGRGTALLRSALRAPGVEVAVICDLDSSARAKASDAVQAAQNRKPDETEDWKKLMERQDVTAVVSALPCHLHFACYRDALAARKHIYAEKPLCLTVADANALVKQAETAAVVVQVGFQRRFSKQLQTSVRTVRDGSIGTAYDGRGGRFATQPIRQPGEWFSFREKSGDWMLEQAVHNWDLLNWVLGELPVSAVGFGRQDLWKAKDPQRDVSDYYTATLHYRNGLNYTWVHSWLTPPDPVFNTTYEQLIGTKGAVDFAKGVVAYMPGGTERGLQIEKDVDRDTTLLALESFLECVRTGAKPVVGVKEGRDAVLVGLLVRKAVYEGRLVTMEEVLRG